MNSFELFCEVLFELLLRSLLFSRTFYLRFASLFIALSRGDLFILSLLCPFVNPFFRFLLFLHFISLFLSLFVHFALLLCSFDIKSDNCASLSCHFTRCFLYFVLMIYSVWLRHSSLLTETLYSSSFSTDINASCGTDTDPSCLIRFFPSFCFSNSFFFLVISPP